jgi:hypothetical protein
MVDFRLRRADLRYLSSSRGGKFGERVDQSLGRNIMLESEAIQKVSFYAFKRFPCLLCAAPPVFGGAFIPFKSHEKRYGVKPGKGRAFGYALCQKCHDLPDVKNRVEALLLFRSKQKSNKNIHIFSKNEPKELSEFLEGQPCVLCNSWTDHFLQRELDEKESADLGIEMLVVPACDSCMEDPGVYNRLEENLRKFRMAKQEKPGKVLPFGKKRKWANKKPGRKGN